MTVSANLLVTKFFASVFSWNVPENLFTGIGR